MATWKSILSWTANPIELLYLCIVPEWPLILETLFGDGDEIYIESKINKINEGIEFSIYTKVKDAKNGSNKRNVTKEWKDVIDDESELISIFLIVINEVDSHLKEILSIKSW